MAKPAGPASGQAKIVPKPQVQLKKGQIAVVGSVESVAAGRKSLVLMVDRIMLPGVTPMTLNPARRKTVYVKSVAAGIGPGARVRAVGRNEGVGTALNADRLEIVKQQPPTEKPDLVPDLPPSAPAGPNEGEAGATG
jgi:hypothetical protein